MELFTKIVNGSSFFTIIAKSSILDVWQGSEFPSELSNNLQKKLYIKQYSFVHGQIHMILISTYLLNNENYDSVS